MFQRKDNFSDLMTDLTDDSDSYDSDSDSDYQADEEVDTSDGDSVTLDLND
ncbi:MAG TPA: hypothetical protein VF209_00720 [Patescibacteria group bacterium]